MRYRSLNADGDMTAGQGGNNFLEGRGAVAQAIKTHVMLFLGEWWENADDGLPFFERIARAYGNEALQRADLELRSRVASTTGVTKITSWSSELNNRKFTVECTVETPYGEVEVVVDGI